MTDQSELDSFRAYSDDRILVEIGAILTESDPKMYSPEGLRDRAEEYIMDQLLALRAAVCGNDELLKSNEIDLTLGILGVLSAKPAAIAMLASIYIARKGHKWICPDS